MFNNFLKLTLIDGGYVIEDSRGAFDFLMELDRKGWLDRADFNRGRNFFLKGADRFDAFKVYCASKWIGIIVAKATTFTTNTYDDHRAHCYAFSSAPLNQKKAWVRIRIAEMKKDLDENRSRSADSYYNTMDTIRKFSAALQDKTELEYDPMGVWFGRMSN